MYQIETFKKIKSEKKIRATKKPKRNTTYGTSGNTGKNYTNRSFGGGMSNRKYTTSQVEKHKLLKNKERTGEVSNIKPDNKILVPPLYPLTLGSTDENNRSGYINPHNTTNIPNPNNINKYIYPSQELENINMVKKIEKPKKYSINIKNINNNDMGSFREDRENRWSDYTYNGGYYGQNPSFIYNPYLYPLNQFDDNNKNIIINNNSEILEDMQDIESPNIRDNTEILKNLEYKQYYDNFVNIAFLIFIVFIFIIILIK